MLSLWWIIIGIAVILILGGGSVALSGNKRVTNPAGRRLLWVPFIFGFVILIISLISVFR
jgi:hypothetical protein